jgi:two-component system, OmpR family, phosphate regulon response regulator PhoB
LRSVIFRYGSIASLSEALSETRGSLPLPGGETVGDGEWVLAIFEIGSRRRATAAAARGVRAAGDAHLEFERRDWERLIGFVAARSEHMRAALPIGSGPTSSARPPLAAPAPTDAPPPSVRAGRSPESTRGHGVRHESQVPPPEPTPRSRRFDDIPPSSALESSRIPFGARILVVDHDGGAGDELRAMLAEMGLVVELAPTTKRAEERMKTKTFDAIVLDLHAPGMDSRAFVGRLRADTRVADIPVLFLSSRSTSRDVVDAFASGGDDFLPKPFRTPELAARIFGLLRRARLAQRLADGSGR